MRRRAIVTGENLIAEGADFLNAMAHADREHKERDQNRKRVDPKAERGQAAQLPDDGDEEQTTGAAASFQRPAYFQTSRAVTRMETPNNRRTPRAPSLMSPMTFANPMMRTSIVPPLSFSMR